MKNVVCSLDDFLILPAKLGEGGFGEVHLGMRLSDGAPCACKLMICRPEATKSLIREITIPAQIRHPAILPIYGFVPPDERNVAMLATPVMAHGGAMKLITNYWAEQDQPEGFTEVVFAKAAYGLAQALRFIHSHGILHRDVKPDNVFLDENWNPKLGDFGLSRKVKVSGEEEASLDLQMTHKLGTCLYMAPELLDDTAEYTGKVDVFAFGVTLYVLHARSWPFFITNGAQTVQVPPAPNKLSRLLFNGYRYKRLDNINDTVWELITACWEQNPDARPTMEEVCHAMRSPEFSIDPAAGDEYMEYVAWLDNEKTEYIPSRPTVQAVPQAADVKVKPFAFKRK